MNNGAFAATLQAETPTEPGVSANGFKSNLASTNEGARGSPEETKKSPGETKRSPEELRRSPAEVYAENHPPKSSSKNDDHAHNEMKHSPSTAKITQLMTKSDKTVAESRVQQAEDRKAWTQSNTFHCIVGLVVIANSISMGIEVDYGKGNEGTFTLLENFWTFIFVCELVLRLRVEGARSYFSEAINIFDFGLVVMSVLDCWMLSPSGAETDLRSLSMLRVVRLARICRLLRLLRVFRELTIIVSSCMSAIAALFWASAFLLIMVYVFAIFSTIFFGRASDCDELPRLLRSRAGNTGDGSGGNNAADECDVYDNFQPDIGTQKTLFGSVDRSMLTLYICLIEGCGIDIVKPMTEKKPVTSLFWLVFIFLTSFGILNLMIGLFCEKVASVSDEHQRLMAESFEQRRQKWLSRLNEMWHEIDNDHSGQIGREEFYEALADNETVMECIEDLGLQHQAGLFDTLDVDGTGEITHAEFFEGMLLIARGQDPAKAKDIVSTYLSCQAIKESLRHVQEQVAEGFKMLRHVGLPSTDAHAAGTGLSGSLDKDSLSRLQSLEARVNHHLDHNRLKDLELRLERRVATHVQGMEERLSAQIKQCFSAQRSTEVVELRQRLVAVETALAKLQQNSTRSANQVRGASGLTERSLAESAADDVVSRRMGGNRSQLPTPSGVGSSSAAPVFHLASSLTPK